MVVRSYMVDLTQGCALLNAKISTLCRQEVIGWSGKIRVRSYQNGGNESVCALSRLASTCLNS